MKKTIFSILIFMFFTSCDFTSQEFIKIKLWDIEAVKNNDNVYISIINYKYIDFERKNYSPQKILDFLFKDLTAVHPKILIVKDEVAYINLEGDREYITERSGSTGATDFAAKVVFNLTEFENIEYVYFIDSGSHFIAVLTERIDFWHLLTLDEKKKYKKLIEDRLNFKQKELLLVYLNLLEEIGDAKTIEKLVRVKHFLDEKYDLYAIERIDEVIEKIKNSQTEKQ